jgi:hypothetical protein
MFWNQILESRGEDLFKKKYKISGISRSPLRWNKDISHTPYTFTDVLQNAIGVRFNTTFMPNIILHAFQGYTIKPSRITIFIFITFIKITQFCVILWWEKASGLPSLHLEALMSLPGHCIWNIWK